MNARGTPRVAVLMSVHNGDRWLPDAVESLFAQTEGRFELFVVDDGSTDGTSAILRRYKDPRLKVVHQPRVGLTRSLNRALALAVAPLIARMDADDVAVPHRFADQLNFLESHPDVGLLGTGCHEITPTGEVVRTIRPPIDDVAIRRCLIRENPFVHSSVVMRRTALDAVGGYDEHVAVAQDYDLWMRMSLVTRMANLPDALVLRRLVPGQVSSARDDDRLRTEVRVKARALRSGFYPLWCTIFLVKPLLGLALPIAWRRYVRSRLTGSRPRRA